jgi:hypothetical protein
LKNSRARPVVKLDVGSFRSKEYGNIPAPAFQIVGFEGVDDEDVEVKQTLNADLNDKIPSFAA